MSAKTYEHLVKYRFKPGQSGNLAGKPAYTADQRAALDLARKLTLKAVQRMEALLDCGEPKVELGAAKELCTLGGIANAPPEAAAAHGSAMAGVGAKLDRLMEALDDAPPPAQTDS